MTEKEKQNIDLTGSKWMLAPGGREILDKCQSRTWHIQLEILALSSLFRNMNSFEVKDNELYGLSLMLERIGKRLGKISDEIGKSILSKE
jgi:hypothetical protein